jgi:hypothetical protein
MDAAELATPTVPDVHAPTERGEPPIAALVAAKAGPAGVQVLDAVQSFCTLDAVLKYCSPMMQVGGSAVASRAG